MKIVWDEPKRLRNLSKHSLDFQELDVDFFIDALIIEARERRLKAIGFAIGDVIAVVFASLGKQGISIISMRPASRKERRLYEDFQANNTRPH